MSSQRTTGTSTDPHTTPTGQRTGNAYNDVTLPVFMEPENLSKAVSAIFSAQLERLQETNPHANAEDLHAALARSDNGTSGPDRRLSFPISAVTNRGVGAFEAYAVLHTLYTQGHLRTVPGYGEIPPEYMLTPPGVSAVQARIERS